MSASLIRDVIMPSLVQLTVASERSHIRFPFPQLGSKKMKKRVLQQSKFGGAAMGRGGAPTSLSRPRYTSKHPPLPTYTEKSARKAHQHRQEPVAHFIF